MELFNNVIYENDNLAENKFNFCLLNISYLADLEIGTHFLRLKPIEKKEKIE